MPALLLLCAAQFMVILDITVVNVALPSIQAELGIPIGDLQWVVTAYTLAFGGLLLPGGRAADLLGRRRVFLSGLAVFTGASLAAALAGSTEALLAARVAQGVGAALLSPAALSLVTTIFPDGPERRRALAAWAAVAAGGGAFGVLAGGILTETLGWAAIFLVNVPVGIVVALAALRTLPAARPGVRGRIDVAGTALATASLVALIYGLVEAPAAGWGSPQTLALLAAAVLGLTAFVLVEARVREPLVALSVFRRRPTVTALVLMMAGMGTVMSAFFFLTLYLQHVLGHSALRTGLEFLPGAVLLVIAAHAGGALVARVGAKAVLAGGMALGAAGALLLSGVPAGGSYAADVLGGMLVLDAGIGLSASAIFITAMAGGGRTRVRARLRPADDIARARHRARPPRALDDRGEPDRRGNARGGAGAGPRRGDRRLRCGVPRRGRRLARCGAAGARRAAAVGHRRRGRARIRALSGGGSAARRPGCGRALAGAGRG